MLQLFLLPILSGCTNPVVLLPGLYGSSLTASYDEGFAQHWYCPESMDNDVFWVNYRIIIPPAYNCLFEMLRAYYDEEQGRVTSLPGMSVDVPDYGGETGIAYADSEGAIFGWKFFESFAPLLEYLKSKGYVLKKNLWGSPYDWRLAMSGLGPDFFPRLKSLVETAYETSGGQKVTILGYSCGGLVIQQFFTTYVTEEWKETYIEKALFLAPAFAGAPLALDVSWNKYFPIVPFFQSDALSETIESLPCLHTLYPNHEVFGDKPVIIDINGSALTARDVPDFLVQHGKISSKNEKLMRANVEVTKKAPADPKVKSAVFYNSKIQTIVGITFNETKNYDVSEQIYGEGDGTVAAIGPRYACNNWDGVICIDFNSSDEDNFDHVGLSVSDIPIELIHKYITNSLDVTEPGHYKIEYEGNNYKIVSDQ